MKVNYFVKRELYWIDFTGPNGKRHRKPTHTATRQQAEMAAPAIIAAVLAPVPLQESIPSQAPVRLSGLSLRAAFNKRMREHPDWIDCKDKAGKEKTLLKCFTVPGDKLPKGLPTITEDTDCAVLTYDVVVLLRAYWKEQDGKRPGTKLTNSTVNHRLSMLNVLQKTAKCQPHGVDHLSVKNNLRKRRTRPEEMEAVAQWCMVNHHRKDATTLADLILVARDTTARMGELLALEWKDIYFERDTIVYRDPKNGEAREGAMWDTAKRVLERRKALGGTGPFTAAHPRQISDLWRSAREAIGLGDDPEFVFHVATRHEGLSKMAEANLSVILMQSMSGHKTLEALKRYTKVSTQAALAAQYVVNGPSSDKPQGGTDA